MGKTSLMSTVQIRDAAKKKGFVTARKLSEASGLSLSTAHKILNAGDGDECLHESVLRRGTVFFANLNKRAASTRNGKPNSGSKSRPISRRK